LVFSFQGSLLILS